MRVSLFLVGVAEYDDTPSGCVSYVDLPAELEELLAVSGDDWDPTVFKIDFVKGIDVDYADPEDEDEGSSEHDQWREKATQEALDILVGHHQTIADLINDKT
tara:strand:+ start:885 stop:1190 length:306 start_codon:yes stop_codon:yes gene_type:complete